MSSRELRKVRAAAAIVTAVIVSSAAAETPARSRLHPGIRCRTDATQTYTLYLPPTDSGTDPRPALLILDPRGRSQMAAALFEPAAERFGWILVSSDNTRSDGPMAPNHRALAALWAELTGGRWPVDRRRLYAAGFSGGAHFSWMLGHTTGGLAGVIACGGRFLPEFLEGVTFSHFGVAGTTDFNNQGMRLVDSQLARQGTAHRLEFFDGPHQWMPPELAMLAVGWMEVDAMKRDLRVADDGVIDELMADDLEAARALSDRGERLEGQRRLAAVAETYRGLRDVTDINRQADELAADTAVRRDIKEERRLQALEEQARRRMFNACAALRESATPMSVGRFAADLQIRQLETMARGDTMEGVAARRILNTIFTQTAFYLTRELMAEGAYTKAAVALTVATRIDPADATAWYNLACAHARNGDAAKAMDALETAVAEGFSDSTQMASDPDLAAVRNTDRFKRIADPVAH